MTIDYKGLLQKYIEHVHECEGVTFIENRSWPLHASEGSTAFTKEEWAELERLAKLNEFER